VSESETTESLPSSGRFAGRSQIPPLVEEEVPVSKYVQVLERTELWSRDSPGPEIKIDCAGEGQQQFTRLTDRPEWK
jgi:hypothetical protein